MYNAQPSLPARRAARKVSVVVTVLLGGGLENRLSWSTRNRQVIFRRTAMLLVVTRLPREQGLCPPMSFAL